MSEALQYFYYFFASCLDFIFNDTVIATNITVGWIIVSVLVMGMVVRSVINLPRSVHIRHYKNNEEK